MLLPTTTVGSFPKPPYLTRARGQLARGEICAEELRLVEEQATREVIALQEELGLDVLVDGEMYRGDMVTYFAENLEGFAVSGLVRSYGNRYYRKPIITGPLRRPRPVTVEWWEFAQSLTAQPVKGMLTGPYTIMDWSFDEHYPSRRHACLALAEIVAEEAADLEAGGAQYIQIDEPAVSTRPEELPLAIEALSVVTSALSAAKTVSHICYGDFASIYPQMLELPVDQLDLETFNSGGDLFELFRRTPYTKEIGLGSIDVHTHVVEEKEDVKTFIRQALEVLPVEKVYISPDCGLKTRTWEEARAKLAVMVSAVHELRQELGEGGAGTNDK